VGEQVLEDHAGRGRLPFVNGGTHTLRPRSRFIGLQRADATCERHRLRGRTGLTCFIGVRSARTTRDAPPHVPREKRCAGRAVELRDLLEFTAQCFYVSEILAAADGPFQRPRSTTSRVRQSLGGTPSRFSLKEGVVLLAQGGCSVLRQAWPNRRAQHRPRFWEPSPPRRAPKGRSNRA